MSYIIFDVDTQNDICYNKSEISREVVSNIKDIFIESMRNEVVILSSVFAHENDMYGFGVIGTHGQEKIKETIVVEPEFYYNVANTRNGIDMNVAEECWQIVFEKQGSDIWDVSAGQPDNVQTFLRYEDVKTVYIVGNNYHGSVIHTINGLLKRKYNVKVVMDAVNWDTGGLDVKEYLKQYIPDFDNVGCIDTEQFFNDMYL